MNFAYLISNRTVPAYPLGEPYDGRPRYGMTPAQADIYRWLVQHKPHHGAFGINFREVAWRMTCHQSKIHDHVRALVERGWIEDLGEYTKYRFVHPVKKFKESRIERARGGDSPQTQLSRTWVRPKPRCE